MASVVEGNNIVLIIADDLDVVLDGMVPLQNTRNIIGVPGATYTNCFVASPICCPNRASILTGKYQHNHLTFNNSISGGCSNSHWQRNFETQTFATILKEQKDYNTFYAGKYLNQYGTKAAGGSRYVPPGWDWWLGLVGNSKYFDYFLSINGTEKKYGNNTDDYLTDVIAKQAVNFINGPRNNEKPFLMVLSPPAPHAPFTSAPRHNNKYVNIKAKKTPNFNTGPQANKHWLVRMGPSPLPQSILPELDNVYRRRWETLLSVDELIMKVYQALKAKNILNNTYIIFTSDNGYHIGNLPVDKRQPYETDIRVPLLIRGPGIVPSKIIAPVSSVDLFATILQMGGVEMPSDGVTMLNKNISIDRTLLIEYRGEHSNHPNDECPNDDANLSQCHKEMACKCEDSLNNTYACIRRISKDLNNIFCVFEDDEKYIEAYNLSADPNQMNNIGYTMKRKLRYRFKKRLKSMVRCHDYKCIRTKRRLSNFQITIINVTMDQEDCAIEVVGTPTQKKLKQARLPFQSLSSSEASDTVANKKRKLTSPSPTNWKSEKIARKENAIKATDDSVVDSKNEKSGDQKVLDDESSDLSKKSDGRILSKPNALTRFLQKGSVSTVNIKPQELSTDVPVLILKRCDEETDREKSDSIANDDSTNSLNSNKNKYESNLNDSINEKSTKQEEVISDNSVVECADISAINSDVESEISSSEDDDNDDDKKSNDDTDDVEQKTDSNLDKTPTSNKNAAKVEAKKRKLTPRQLEKKLESQKKQEERQKLKAEREKQRLEKKMKWRQEKEAEREQKRKEKEHKELKKQMEIEQKQKEKERKEEDRRKREEAKEEEKRKKEEERLELERKKQKAASTFVSFFVPKKLETKAAVEEKVIGACNFMPFEIKADMKVAPTCRRSLSNAEKLAMDTVCFVNTVPLSKLYLNEIKNDKSNIHRCGKTWPAEAKDDVVVLDEDDVDTANIVDQTSVVMEKHHPKLFSFAENRRPPYWGTWRKKSTKINPRRPFSKDE
ncbi:hypothetical protein PV326_009828 [Microctonus aethiopoides]|nr:hypothetical protein PV326_009828 [Microctonus aethiopoides]